MADVPNASTQDRSGLDFRNVLLKDAPISDPVPGVTICASSANLGWSGAYAEIGQSHEWAAEEFVINGADYLGINLDTSLLPVEVGTTASSQSIRMDPSSVWIQRREEPFSMRFGRSFYGGLSIERERSIRILGDGRELDLATRVGVTDDVLTNSLRALFREMQEGSPSGPLVADALLIAIVGRLATKHQICRSYIDRSGLSRKLLGSVIAYVRDHLESPITVSDMAAVAGLSPFHFSREFRRRTGSSPHAFVTIERIERSKTLLRKRLSVTAVALACGFTDHAHFARTFKGATGLSPSEYASLAAR